VNEQYGKISGTGLVKWKADMENHTARSPEYLLKRIDAIIAELQSLRQTVITMRSEPNRPNGDIVDELAGALGQGSWDEYDHLQVLGRES
jgi:hypothetical protein